MGRPDPVLLAEAGPGRGTLMADALRAIGRVAPDFRAALRLHLVETSPRLRALQARAPAGRGMARAASRTCRPGRCCCSPTNSSTPCRSASSSGAARAGPSASSRTALSSSSPSRRARRSMAEDGEVVEICEPARAVAADARRAAGARRAGRRCSSITARAERAPGDSLQALRRRPPGRPARPSRAAPTSPPMSISPPSPTRRAPPGPRCTGRSRRASSSPGSACSSAPAGSPAPSRPREAAALIAAARRLAEPDRMGRLFKALALCHPGAPTPPGFDA